MSAVVTITLPVPTAYAVDATRFVAWLAERGYAIAPVHPYEWDWIVYRRANEPRLLLPNPSEWSADEYAHAHALAGSVAEAAEAEGIEPHTLAALLAPTAPGPALQWAHMADASRAAALADIDTLARQHRREAARLRDFGAGEEQALEAEGRAMGLEAAAAVLRGGPPPAPDFTALRGELMRAGQIEALTVLDGWAAGRRGSEG